MAEVMIALVVLVALSIVIFISAWQTVKQLQDRHDYIADQLWKYEINNEKRICQVYDGLRELGLEWQPEAKGRWVKKQ